MLIRFKDQENMLYLNDVILLFNKAYKYINYDSYLLKKFYIEILDNFPKSQIYTKLSLVTKEILEFPASVNDVTSAFYPYLLEPVIPRNSVTESPNNNSQSPFSSPDVEFVKSKKERYRSLNIVSFYFQLSAKQRFFVTNDFFAIHRAYVEISYDDYDVEIEFIPINTSSKKFDDKINLNKKRSRAKYFLDVFIDDGAVGVKTRSQRNCLNKK